MVLVTSYYRTVNQKRNDEIDLVLEKNIANQFFERIILFCEKNIFPPFINPKIEIIESERPTYFDFFKIGNKFKGSIIVTTNSDIFFDSTIQLAGDFIGEGRVLALTRYEFTGSESGSIMKMGCDSQDTWIYKSPIDLRCIKSRFHLGIPGCDNRIAYELSRKYDVINPSLSIKTYHIHDSDYRTYNVEERIPEPYLQIHIE